MQYPSTSLDLLGDRHEPVDMESAPNSRNYIKAKSSTLKRWVINYPEPTGIRINLMSAQSDNRTNLDISKPNETVPPSGSMMMYASFS